jgi:hypothetical protein
MAATFRVREVAASVVLREKSILASAGPIRTFPSRTSCHGGCERG